MMLISPDQKVAIIGAGELGRAIYKALRATVDSHSVIDLCDRCPEKTGGTVIPGVDRILSLDDAAQNRYDLVILGFNASDSEYAYFKDQLIQRFRTQILSAEEVFQQMPEIRGWPMLDPEIAQRRRSEADFVVSSLADSESRHQYQSYYEWVCRTPSVQPVVGTGADQYFPEGVVPLTDSEVFADFGAYNGDTLRMFLERTSSSFEEYYAFEPDLINFASLVSGITSMADPIRSKIRLFNQALGEKTGYINFSSDASQNSRKEVSMPVERWVQALGLPDVQFRQMPTFVKLDLEGSDLGALLGGIGCIVNWRPKLCVAIYHNPGDFIDIPLLLIAALKNYSFFVRAHNRFALDFVFYCIPNEQVTASLS
jgi:FkbM family methyltransferase